MDSLKCFHSDSGVHLCDFIENDFSWGQPKFSHKEKWIGFWHNPPKMPKWFDYHNSPESILNRPTFNKYLKNCIAIFTLSNYLRDYLSSRLDVPVFSLYHPTELKVIKWNPDLFLKNKTITQVGYWLRKIHSITKITKKYKLEWLPSDYDNALHQMKMEAYSLGHNHEDIKSIWSKVKIHKHLDNESYDKKLISSIVLCDMYDSSANNAIIEAIARNCPIIAPKLPSVVEYLGAEYPLYIDGPIDDLLLNDKIFSSYEYLKSLNKDKISSKFFKSEIKKCLLKLDY